MKYYKIISEDHIHNGYEYKEGLNILGEGFNPSGDCEPGGFYFAREDILCFIDYGTWLYEVEIPADAQVYENHRNPKKWKADKIILKNKRRIDQEAIKYLVENGADIHARDDLALRWAAGNCHLEVVKYLVEQGADIHARDDSALQLAAANGELEVVKYLVENGADIHACDDSALQFAALNCHLETVKYLAEHVADIHACDDLK